MPNLYLLMKELKHLNKYFWRYRWRMFAGILFILLSNWFSVLQPQVIGKAIDYVTAELRTPEKVDKAAITWNLVWFGGTVLVYALLMGIFMYFMRQTIIVMSRLIERDLRNEIFEHYENLDTAFYRRNNTGDLMSRVTEDVNKVRMYVGPAILYGVNLIGSFLLTLVAMLQISPELTFYTLLPLPVLSFSIYQISKRINMRTGIVQKQLAKLNSTVQEVFSGIRVVKTYVREKEMEEHFAEECEDYRQKSLSLVKTDALFFPTTLLLIGCSTILTLYVGGSQVMAGKATTGDITAFVIFISKLTFPFMAIGWIASIIQSASASQKRINEFLKTQPSLKTLAASTSTVDTNAPYIAFDNVGFTYQDSGITGLKNVSFDIKAGETIAIVGRTGSGKSTLAELLLRMYDVNTGQIRFNGQDIRSLQPSELRRSIGYVPQDVFLFSDTVSNNIRFGKRSATQEEVEQYAKYAAVYNDINDLPEGFNTVIGERGVTLSGGQKQRLSIARALIKQPDLILLDDCLSALDAKTEHQITAYLKEACAGKTTIVITHRIYASLQFDKILVLENGELSQVGTHEELIEKGGYYADLLEQQRLSDVSVFADNVN